MADFPPSLPGRAGPETATRAFADDQIEVRREAHAVYMNGVLVEGITGKLFQLIDLVAERPGALVWSQEAREKIWGTDELVDPAHLSGLTRNLQERLGPVLGDPEDGAVRYRPYYGVWAARTLAYGGVIPRPEADSPARTFASGRIAVYPDQAVVLRDGEIIEDLTVTEYELLAELARRPGRIAGASPLKQLAGVTSTGALGHRISDVRKKLGKELGDPRRGAILAKSGGFMGQKTFKPA